MEKNHMAEVGPVDADTGSPDRISGEKGEAHAAVDTHHVEEKFGRQATGREFLAPQNDLQHVADKIDLLSVDEAREILANMLVEHEYDYNFSSQLRNKIEVLLEGPVDKVQTEEDWALELKTEAALNKFYSPYPEVRAVTTPDDDFDMPCETLRAHFLGYSWAIIGQFVNSLFASRFPNISLSSSVAQLLIYPCGLGLAFALPDWGFTVRGTRVSLNPGPWTYKEQMLATIIMDVGIGTSYCFSNIQTQTIFYHDKWLTPGYGILLLLSTQMMGLGFSGILRRFVVYPIETIWPNILPTVALNRALLVPEPKETIHGWRLTRYQLFFFAFAAMFLYYWIPGYLFPALGVFSWMTWIAPSNFNVNLITGGNGGLGFNPIPTFDWNYINYEISPLAAPFFASAQSYVGALLGGLVIIGLIYSNVSGSAYLPPNSSSIFDNQGLSYNISRVIKPGTGDLIEEEYQKYSPAFYSAGNLQLYGTFFAWYPLTMVFICLDAWRPLSRAFKAMGKSIYSTTKNFFIGTKNGLSSLAKGNMSEAWQHLGVIFRSDGSIYDGFDDPLAQLMRKYPEVPDSWFLAIAFVSFIFAIVILVNWPQLDTPVWTIFFVIGLNLIFLIPMSYLEAISGSNEGLNIITELIVGYALPGKPEALMFVKAYGYNINGQTDNYVSDQKMGYYAKIPPRAMYRGQMLSAFLSAIITYAVVQFVDTSFPGICTPDQRSKFTCASGSVVYFSASVVWGAIGPKRIFSQIYPAMKYCFLFGFLLGLAWWALKRGGPFIREKCRASMPSGAFNILNKVVFTPISWMKHVHPSLVFNGALGWAPANLNFWTGGLYMSFAFMWYLRRYKTAWWEKYTYVLSAALGGGLAFSALIIFFAVEYNPKYVNWWGSLGFSNTLDGNYTLQRLPIPEKGYFGPDTWH